MPIVPIVVLGLIALAVVFWPITLALAVLIVVVWMILRKRKKERLRAWEMAVASSGIDEVDQMSGKEFEEKMWVHFKQLGWQPTRTPDSNDYGADLILKSPDGKKIVVQLKRYSNSVGVSAVQEVAGAINHYHADYGMLITNSHVTKNARNLAQTNKVVIWEREDLIESLAKVHAQLSN
jgi:restriction system protein